MLPNLPTTSDTVVPKCLMPSQLHGNVSLKLSAGATSVSQLPRLSSVDGLPLFLAGYGLKARCMPVHIVYPYLHLAPHPRI